MPDTIPGDSTTTALITGTGEFRSALEHQSDIDWWRVELTAGLTYNFFMSGDGSGAPFDGTLRLRDGLGGSIDSRSAGGWMAFTAPASGTYFIEVADSNPYDGNDGFGGIEGGYVIRTQMSDTILNNASTTATITGSGTTIGNLEANTDSDWYRVNLVAGQHVGFSVTPNGDLTFNDANVRILDQFGNRLSTASLGANNQATANILTSGTYFVEVVDSNPYDGNSGNGGAEGAFALISRMSDNVWNNSTTTSRLIDGGTLRGNIDAYGDSDWHAFTAVAGRTYTFTMSGTAGADSLASMELYLRDAGGASVMSRTGYTSSGGAVITWTATTSGTYYLDADYRDYSGNIGAYNLSVVSNSPVIRGTTGNDTLNGGANNNTIYGNNGADLIFGNAGNDTLYGDAGNDTLNGGDGNDVLIGGAGNDVLNGGAGSDTANFAGNVAVTVDLTRTTAQATGYGLDRLISIENVIGGNLADRIIGNGAANALTGGGGNDTLMGGAGNDTLNGGAGNDVLNGGAGNDTVVFSGNAAIRVDLNVTTAQATGQGSDTLISIENLITGGGNDRLVGNGAANRLTSGAGNDTLLGGAGNDTLNGGLGNDLLDGGAGIDTIVFTSTGAIRVDLSVTAAQNTGQGMDTIRNVENVIGGSGNDRLTGNAGANNLQGGAGNDTLTGGAGNDTLLGGAGNDRLIGGAGRDVMTGGAGADIFAFGRNDGNDRILDWQDGTDLIHITSGASSFADLSVQQIGQDTQISFASTTITLAGVSYWYISSSDFMFG